MKILHLTFHNGCINDIQYVCDKLGHEITHLRYDTVEELKDIDKENWHLRITPELAKKSWDIRKDFYQEFDCIITSDTVPLSRIFLQDNNWKKKLIVWICNQRFDYPRNMDKEFYDLIKDATNKNNVKIIPSTVFEQKYTENYGIFLKEKYINVIGKSSSLDRNKKYYDYNQDISKKFFVPNRHNEKILKFNDLLLKNNIDFIPGDTNKGPNNFGLFKGVIFLPYAWSTISFFENIQNCVTHIVPSYNLLINLLNKRIGYAFQDPQFLQNFSNLSDCYNPIFSDFIEYFNNIDELKYITEKELNKNLKQKKMYSKFHEKLMLERWRQALND